MAGLLIIVVIIVAVNLSLRLINHSLKNSYGKKVRWMFGGYIIILLIATILSAFISEPKYMNGKKEDMQQLAKEEEDLNSAATKGQIKSLGAKYKKKTWNFDYHGKQLNIAIRSDHADPGNTVPNDILIVVERKSTNDGKIEAGFYKTDAAINEQVITFPVTPPVVKLAGNSLTIQNKITEINYNQVTNAFPIRQFTGENSANGFSFFEGGSILFLRIPKDLQLTPHENLNLQYAI